MVTFTSRLARYTEHLRQRMDRLRLGQPDAGAGPGLAIVGGEMEGSHIGLRIAIRKDTHALHMALRRHRYVHRH